MHAERVPGLANAILAGDPVMCALILAARPTAGIARGKTSGAAAPAVAQARSGVPPTLTAGTVRGGTSGAAAPAVAQARPGVPPTVPYTRGSQDSPAYVLPGRTMVPGLSASGVSHACRADLRTRNVMLAVLPVTSACVARAHDGPRTLCSRSQSCMPSGSQDSPTRLLACTPTAACRRRTPTAACRPPPGYQPTVAYPGARRSQGCLSP